MSSYPGESLAVGFGDFPGASCALLERTCVHGRDRIIAAALLHSSKVVQLRFGFGS